MLAPPPIEKPLLHVVGIAVPVLPVREVVRLLDRDVVVQATGTSVIVARKPEYCTELSDLKKTVRAPVAPVEVCVAGGLVP